MSLIRDSLTMLIWRVLATLVAAATAVLIARWLGPEERGVLATFVLSLSLVTLLLQFGMPEALIYILGSQQHPAQQVVGSAMLLAAVTSMVLAPIGWWAMAEFTDIAFSASAGLIIAGMLSIHATYARHLLLGFKRFAAYSMSMIAESLVYLMGVVALWAFGALSVSHILGIYALSLSTSAAVAWILVARAMPGKPLIGRSTKAIIHECARRGVHLLSAGLGGFGIQRLCYFLLEFFSGSRAVGLYAAASAVPALFANGAQQLSTVLYSHVSARVSDKDGLASTLAVFQILMLTVLVMLVPLAVFADELVGLLFGQAYEGIGNTVILLALAMGLAGLSSALFNALAGMGRHGVGSIQTALVLSAVAGFGFMLVPKYGLAGAAVAQLAANTFGLVLMIAVYRRTQKIALRAFFRIPWSSWRLAVRKSFKKNAKD